MATSDFSFPVLGVTGPEFRDGMEDAFQALVTTNSSSTDPPVTYANMLQVKEGSPPTLRVRNAANNAWVTLMPDLTQSNGGIVIPELTEFNGNKTFNNNVTVLGDGQFSTATFNGNVIFSGNVGFAINPGWETPAGVEARITNRLNAENFSKFGRRRYGIDLNLSPGNSHEAFHGLGSRPDFVSVSVVLTSSQAGWSSGDELVMPDSAYVLRYDGAGYRIRLSSTVSVIQKSASGLANLSYPGFVTRIILRAD